MTARRAYTIVIHDHSAAILRRFRITHRFLIGAIAGTLSLSTIGVISGLVVPPLAIGWWVLHSKVETLEVQNLALVEEKQRMDGMAAEVGDRLGRLEADTLKLSALAEIAGSGPAKPSRPAGGPPAGATGEIPGLDKDIADVRRRALALDRKLNDLEATFLKQADRISSIPLLRPADGPDGDGFGWREDPFTRQRDHHEGLDILAPYGAPVHATADGTVAHSGYATGYGLSVFLSHSLQLETRYGHLSRLMVRPGQHVDRGQVIGYVGNTGRSAGPHLHYETLLDGERVDPNRFLKAKPGTWLARLGN